jgi:RNA polymerase sporulation-specific sigma factor
MEEQLFNEYKKTGDLEIKNNIAIEYDKIACSVCDKFGYNEDMLQEARILLLEAIDEYNTEKEMKFSTFAYSYIKYGLLKYLSENVAYDGNLSRSYVDSVKNLKEKLKQFLEGKLNRDEFTKKEELKLARIEKIKNFKSLDALDEFEDTLYDEIGDKRNLDEDYLIYKMDLSKILTKKEMKVLNLMEENLTVELISKRLGFSERSVFTILKEMKPKILNYFNRNN